MPGTPTSDARAVRRIAEPGPTSPDASADRDARRRLLWLAGAPAAVTALLSAVTAGYLWAGGIPDSGDLLAAGYLVAALVLAVVAGQAARQIRRTDHRLGTLRASAADARAESDRLAERLRAAEERPAPVRTPAGRQVEVFVNLSRRLQSLVHREIKLLDALENEVEDPDLLKGLFQVDHLATRIRRHAENLAVLGGAVSRRQWSRPVALTEVLRSAIAEVEHYSRVKLVPPIEGTVPGHAVASIIHLVAELIENATMFASPQTQVLLRAQHVTAGVAIEVEDRGLGMQRADQERVNRLLANPEDIDLDELLSDGRIGLFVVSMIARQHGVTVRLQGNIYGGTQAIVILPHSLLGPAPEDPAANRQTLTDHTVELAKRDLAAALNTSSSSWPAFSQRAVSAGPAPAGPASTAPASAGPASAGPVPAAPAALPASATFADRPATRSPARTAQPAHSAQPAHKAQPAHTAQFVHAGHKTPAAPAGQKAGAAGEPAPDQRPQPVDIRPPLPRRHSQTHLAPQLQVAPRTPAHDPAGGHDPGLMASFMRGVSLGEADDDTETVRPDRADGND